MYLEVRCTASPPRASGRPTRLYTLVIAVTTSGLIRVEEAPSHPLLPKFCPQRHMNPDGTFCLGLNAGIAIIDAIRAKAWWKKLGVFLTCQDTAFETGSWPPLIEISHGTAGEIEIQAENIAEGLGLLKEFQLAVREDRGSIAEGVRRIRKSTGRLLNGRAACICGRTYRSGEVHLRRDCWKAGWPCLPIMEALRRREEEAFWRGLKGKQLCCHTMDDCPLRCAN